MEHSTIRLELGINAQRFIQQVQLNNELIESQIQKGIELALDDIAKSDNFIEIIRENTKTELQTIVNKAVMSWEVRSKIEKMVAEKIGKKIEEFAEKIAEKVTSSLDV